MSKQTDIVERAEHLAAIERNECIAADPAAPQPDRDVAERYAAEYREMVAQIDRRCEPDEPLPKWYVRHAEEWAEADMEAWAGA